MVDLQKSLDAEKFTREEVEKRDEECVDKLKQEHKDALVQARDEGYEEAISNDADEVENTIYRAGYEFGLDNVGISNDH